MAISSRSCLACTKTAMQHIMEETIHIIHAMDKRNFLHIDAIPWNVMIRERKNGGFPQPIFIDFALSRARDPEESDAKWYEG